MSAGSFIKAENLWAVKEEGYQGINSPVTDDFSEIALRDLAVLLSRVRSFNLSVSASWEYLAGGVWSPDSGSTLLEVGDALRFPVPTSSESDLLSGDLHPSLLDGWQSPATHSNKIRLPRREVELYRASPPTPGSALVKSQEPQTKVQLYSFFFLTIHGAESDLHIDQGLNPNSYDVTKNVIFEYAGRSLNLLFGNPQTQTKRNVSFSIDFDQITYWAHGGNFDEETGLYGV